jgi:hypothetical protein
MFPMGAVDPAVPARAGAGAYASEHWKAESKAKARARDKADSDWQPFTAWGTSTYCSICCQGVGETMHAQLVPSGGGSPIDIVKDLTLVGRREDCDLRLEHKSVSKTHCVIVKSDGMLMVRDLGSTNGTRVNGQRVRRAMLLPDDEVHIATCKFKVHLGPDPSPRPSDEGTQQLDADEVAHLLRQAKQKSLEDSDEDILPQRPLHPNALPDVYPDEKG